ncbi:MAG: hypothetical protein Q9163_006086 [Psora crenata]
MQGCADGYTGLIGEERRWRSRMKKEKEKKEKKKGKSRKGTRKKTQWYANSEEGGKSVTRGGEELIGPNKVPQDNSNTIRSGDNLFRFSSVESLVRPSLRLTEIKEDEFE